MAAKKRAKAKRTRATARNAFRWDASKREAAQLLAENDFSVEEIAARIGVERTTLWRWKTDPFFAAEVAIIEKRLGNLSLRRVIARRNRRLLALEDRWLRMQQVIEARAADPDHQRASGGETGLLVRRQRVIGSGDNALLIEEFEVDTALLKELRETERQAAQEAGQWQEKHQHEHNHAGSVAHEHAINQSPEHLHSVLGILAEIGALQAPGAGGATPAQVDQVHQDPTAD